MPNTVCYKCGAVIGDKEAHDNFHTWLSNKLNQE